VGSLGRPVFGCSANYVSIMKQPKEIGQHEELWSESNGLQCASFCILWQHSMRKRSHGHIGDTSSERKEGVSER